MATTKIIRNRERFIIVEDDMAPAKYMKKPTYIDAMQVKQSNLNFVAKWVEGTVANDPIFGTHVTVPGAPAGHNRASIGDFVLKNVNGVFSVARADAFGQTYIKA